jgi:hypothetical protein
MGSRGHNAGGFAYMDWVVCVKCGRKFPIGKRNTRRVCSDKKKCEARQEVRSIGCVGRRGVAGRIG